MRTVIKAKGMSFAVGYDKMIGYAFMEVTNDETSEIVFDSDDKRFGITPFSVRDFGVFAVVAKNRWGVDLKEVAKAISLYKSNVDVSRENYLSLLKSEGLEHLSKGIFI